MSESGAVPIDLVREQLAALGFTGDVPDDVLLRFLADVQRAEAPLSPVPEVSLEGSVSADGGSVSADGGSADGASADVAEESLEEGDLDVDEAAEWGGSVAVADVWEAEPVGGWVESDPLADDPLEEDPLAEDEEDDDEEDDEEQQTWADRVEEAESQAAAAAAAAAALRAEELLEAHEAPVEGERWLSSNDRAMLASTERAAALLELEPEVEDEEGEEGEEGEEDDDLVPAALTVHPPTAWPVWGAPTADECAEDGSPVAESILGPGVDEEGGAWLPGDDMLDSGKDVDTASGAATLCAFVAQGFDDAAHVPFDFEAPDDFAEEQEEEEEEEEEEPEQDVVFATAHFAPRARAPAPAPVADGLENCDPTVSAQQAARFAAAAPLTADDVLAAEPPRKPAKKAAARPRTAPARRRPATTAAPKRKPLRKTRARPAPKPGQPPRRADPVARYHAMQRLRATDKVRLATRRPRRGSAAAATAEARPRKPRPAELMRG